MIEFYPQIKHAHVFLALLSGAIFLVRGAGVLAGMRWPRNMLVKWTSYAVDTSLLTAALMLLTILPWAIFGNGWLATKLALLVAYVVLGVFALRKGRTARIRAACYVAALLAYGAAYSVARAHHPLGALHPLLG